MQSGDNSNLPPLAERRPARRNRVLLGGVIVYDEGRHSFTCTIRDLSATGARVAIPKGQLLPRDVYLIDVRARIAHQTKVAWAGAAAAGLNIIRTLDLTKLDDPTLAYLQRILGAHAAR